MTPTDDDGRPDPVEAFFARERAAIEPHAADGAHWAQIVADARRARRHRWVLAAGGAAAAVLLVGGLGVALRPGPDRAATPLQTTSSSTDRSSSPTATTTTATTSTPTPTPPATSGSVPPGEPAVPADFRVVSLSYSGQGTLWALGTTTCAGAPCPALARSVGDRSAWTVVHTFPGRALTQTRFATPSIGWVFGRTAMRTTDGGRTWTDYPYAGGGRLLDLSTDGTDVVLTTAASCGARTCTGPVRVLRAPVTAPDAARPGDDAGAVSGTAGATVGSADISWHGGKAFIAPVLAGGVAQPQVLQVKGLVPVRPSGCTDRGATSIIAPASADPDFFAACPSGGAAGQVGYAVARSADLGSTWTTVPAQRPLLLADAGRASFAAADATHLLAVSGGSPDLHGSLQVSADGGRTWRAPTSPPPVPALGWAWVGSPDPATYFAIPTDPTAGYWTSADRGETWTEVAVAGR